MKNTVAATLFLLCFIAEINAQSAPKGSFYIISFFSTYKKVSVYTMRGSGASFMLDTSDIVSGFPSQKDERWLNFYTPKGKTNQLYFADIKYFIPLENEVLKLQQYQKLLKKEQSKLTSDLQKIARELSVLKNSLATSQSQSANLKDMQNTSYNYEYVGTPESAALQNKRSRQISSLENQENRLNETMRQLPERISDIESLIINYQSLIRGK